MPEGDGVYTRDPLRGFRFRVSIPSIGRDLGFMRVSGLQADVGVYEWQEITDPVTIWKMPDRVKFSDLVLERGVTADRKGLWAWFEQTVKALEIGDPNAIFRRQVSIYLYAKGAPSGAYTYDVGWYVFSAFPKSIKFGDLDATQSAVQIESLTLANEGFSLMDTTTFAVETNSDVVISLT